MAGIDKLETTSYEEFTQFKCWCEQHDRKFQKEFSVRYENLSNYVYSDLTQEDFDGRSIYISNFPLMQDLYLCRHLPCLPFKEIFNKLRLQYGDLMICHARERKTKYDLYDYKKNQKRKVTMTCDGSNKIYADKKKRWFSCYVCDAKTDLPLQWEYNRFVNRIVFECELIERDTELFCYRPNSVKAILRMIRNSRLPKDALVNVYYDNRDFTFRVH